MGFLDIHGELKQVDTEFKQIHKCGVFIFDRNNEIITITVITLTTKYVEAHEQRRNCGMLWRLAMVVYGAFFTTNIHYLSR